jgi:hypothetical protein
MNIGLYDGTFFDSIEHHRSVVAKGSASIVPQDYITVPAAGSLELKTR